MKALVRYPGETITEEMKIPGIDWETGMPLINPDWFGGPYSLVNNYVPPKENDEQIVVSTPDAERNAEIAALKARLAALENDYSSEV